MRDDNPHLPPIPPLEGVKVEAAVRRQARDLGTVRDVIEKVPRVVRKEAVKDDRRPHCKARPNRGSGGGRGKRKAFVPWC